MLKKFETKELIFAALMGALMFVLSFAFGSVLNVALGNPSASAFISTLIQPIIVVVALLIIRKFGVATMMYFIYGVLAIPTNMMGGLPGPLKIVLALTMGLSFDIVTRVGKYNKISLFLGAIVIYLTSMPLLIYFYIKLGIPGADKFIAAAPILIAISVIETFIGIFVGLYVYKKIQNKTIVRQISD